MGTPEDLYGAIARILRGNFSGLLTKAKDSTTINATESFTRQNKDHESIQEYETLPAKGDFKGCGEIRKEVSRDKWGKFLASSKAADLRNVYQYFAMVEDRGNMGANPPVSTPVVGNGKTAFHPQGKAEMLGRFFAKKMAATQDGRKNPGGNRATASGRTHAEGTHSPGARDQRQRDFLGG